ncbi:hypothetical protein [Leuconostoc suionicum]|uniref:hypothetical protein n=1 Tax=Leuconostoc suionicum TaxID=1511761 RepID=UPI00300D1530
MNQKKITIEKLEREKNKNNIISNFMSLSNTKELIKKHQHSLIDTTSFTKELNKSFQDYFSYVLFLSYLNKTLYFKSLHIKQKNNNTITKDKPLDQLSLYQLPTLLDNIDSNLIRSLPWRTILTPRQLFILNKIYIEGYKQNEIAKQLNITPPAINKIKKASLLAIKQYIEKKDMSNDLQP